MKLQLSYAGYQIGECEDAHLTLNEMWLALAAAEDARQRMTAAIPSQKKAFAVSGVRGQFVRHLDLLGRDVITQDGDFIAVLRDNGEIAAYGKYPEPAPELYAAIGAAAAAAPEAARRSGRLSGTSDARVGDVTCTVVWQVV